MALKTSLGNGSAVRKEVADLRRKVSGDQRSLDKLSSAVKGKREKARAQAAAQAVLDKRKECFQKHDKDKDSKLSRKEVVAYSKAELDGFDIPTAVLDKIMQILEP